MAYTGEAGRGLRSSAGDLRESGAQTLTREATEVTEGSAAQRHADREYDFQRLERAIAYLIDEHERLAREKDRLEQEHAALREELVDREQRLAALQQELTSERGRRRTALEGVDKLIERLDQVQASVGAMAGQA
jgi:chromosome segregation ATPase